MTEDNVTSGQAQTNVLTGEPFGSLDPPACIESVVTNLLTGESGSSELWKLNHYYERLDEWNSDHGIAANPFAAAVPGSPALLRAWNTQAVAASRYSGSLGDWGISARWSPAWLDGTLGFYGRNATDILPQVLLIQGFAAAPAGHRQPHLRLRRLPRGLPVEQIRARRARGEARSQGCERQPAAC